MIYIIKHIDIEGPGTLGDFLLEQKEPFCVAELGSGEPLRQDLGGIKAVVVLGGPMNVYEEDKYPFLKAEQVFIQSVLKRKVPYLGICLGSQLLAKASGGKVTAAPNKEIGWYNNIRLTAEGKKDPLLKGFNEGGQVFHWHGDMFHVPSQGQLLATSAGCPSQAFRVGSNAYGIQFHVELKENDIAAWCRAYGATDLPKASDRRRGMIERYRCYKDEFNDQAFCLYENFLKLC